MRLDGNSLRSAWADAKSGRRTDAVVVLAMAEELLRRRLQAKLWDEVKVWWEVRDRLHGWGSTRSFDVREDAVELLRHERSTAPVFGPTLVKCTKRVRRRKK